MLETRVYQYNFLVTLDKAHDSYRTLYMIMRTLLSAYENSEGDWILDFDDFCLLKYKLDQAGLTEGRKANQETLKLLQTYKANEDLNRQIKEGSYNEKVKELLLGKIKTDPYEDQYSGIAYLLKNPRSLLMDVMGTGKTFQALSVIAAVSKPGDKSLVIAPKSVLLGFENEISLHTHLTSLVLPAGGGPSLKALKKNIDGDWDILMVHPESLVKRSKTGLESDVASTLWNMPFKTILIDEFHMYKNPDAKRSQVLSKMLQRIRTKEGKPSRIHPMTGTLVSESPVNAYFALQLTGKGNLPSQVKFEKYFTITKELRVKREGPRGIYFIKVPKVVGYKNLDVLKSRLDRCSIRRTKEDLKGFPKKTIQTRSVILSGTQKTLYKELSEGVKASLSDRDDLNEFFSVNSMGIRLIQLLNHPHLIGETCKSAKYEALEGILEEVLSDPEQKIVLWTEYRDAVDLIYNLWNEKYGVLKLYGGVDIDKDLEKKFVYGKEHRIVAAIPKKAGTGVDFLARARTAVFVDQVRSLTLKSQAVDRLHRRVKTEGELSWLDKMRSKPCTIIFLEAKDTVDEYIRDQMEAKEKMSKASTPTMVTKQKIMKFLR